jgi:lysophospholipase L1-like esterase
MMMSRALSTTPRKVLTLVTALLLGGTLISAQPAAARAVPLRPGTAYLALGDSVTFGYREPNSVPPPNYFDQHSFVGYPEDVGADLSLVVANAACPGETSTSLITGTEPSNGCEAGYRSAYPLHVHYTGSQLDYAVRYLETHRRTELVSLMIGANDGFLCQKTTADQCASELPTVLQTIAANVATILGRIRTQAHYAGQIVIVNYYSLDYRSALQNALSTGLNQAMDAGAAPFNVEIADGFAAFQQAAAAAGGDPCAAGLLTVLATGGCGIHPSFAGQQVLADAVERVVSTA